MASSHSNNPETLFNADEEEEADEQQPAVAPSARERAERAAAAAAARARGEAPPSTSTIAASTSSSSPPTDATNPPASDTRTPAEMPAGGAGSQGEASNVAASASTSQVADALAGAPTESINAVTQALGSTSLSTNALASSTPNDLVKSLSEQLECSICREIVYQPVSVLDCLHTFCGSCLIQWVSQHPGEPECPTCRSPARATKDSHQHNSLRDVLVRMDASQDRSEEEKAEMRRIYHPGSDIDLVQTSRLARTSGMGASGPGANQNVPEGTVGFPQRQMQQPNQQQAAYYQPQMRVLMNPIDELNLLLRFYFPCPTCEPGNPYRFLCERPIPDPRILMVMGGAGGLRPLPRVSGSFPSGHTQCFNCKRPNLMPLRDRRQYPQDSCAICSEHFCQNLLGYCGPIKQGKARHFDKLDSYEMPPRQGLIASTFSNLFGTGGDADSIGTFLPHLFGNDPERVRSFDVWLQQYKKMTLNDFYHAVVREAVAASPQPLVVGGEEQGIPRAPWQGVPGRHMRGNIRKSDWVCINCAKDLIERHAADWYNRQLQIEYPPPTSPLFRRANARGGPATPVRQQQQQIQTAQTGSFFSFSTLKKGFSDIGEKFNEITADAPSVPPPFPTPILANPPVSTFSDRHVLQGNQLPGYPTFLATSRDSDGHPVFLAIFHHKSGAMLPGKMCPNLRNPVRVAWEGSEYALTKDDKYETFLENPEVHKWVRMSNSVMPAAEIPVAAGMERDGRTPLFFACAWYEGLRVPGYTGPNTRGARIPFGGSEVTIQDDYEVLVWRNNPDRPQA